MGIDRTSLNAILMSCRHIKNKQNLLTIGRQQIHTSQENNIDIGDKFNTNLSEIIYGNYCETFFSSVGFINIDSIDNSNYEGSKYIHNLNYPILEDFKNKYDYIYDGGTSEHIFNIPQVFENIIDMLNIDGLFVSVTCNNNFSGHGMYQFSPELYLSCFNQKYGMEIIDMYIAEVGTTNNEWKNVNSFNGYRNIDKFNSTLETYIIIIARKISNERESLIKNSPNQYSYDDHDWKKYTNNKPNILKSQEKINSVDYKIEYGLDDNKINITHTVMSHSLNKEFIEIPTNDEVRATLYGDPCWGVVKFIYVTNSEGAVTKFPDNKSITLDITRGLITKIIEPNYLTVYKSPYDKIRLGKNYDGGYIICDIPDINYDFFLSGGILDDISFEEDFCSKYPNVKCMAYDGFIDNIDIKNNNITFIKQYIGDSNNEYFTNLHSIINQYNNIFIKMDIEGGEIPWINSLSTEQIDKFAQIVIEFHFPFYEKECLVFEKLLTSHVLVHFHANNCCGTNTVKNIKIPNVFECTYIHKKYYTTEIELNTSTIPGTLDMKNVLDKDEIYIDYPPFVH